MSVNVTILTIDQFNALTESAAQHILQRLCASKTWQEAMLAGIPYASVVDLETMAADLWSLTDEIGLVEAFNGYAEISGQGDYRQRFPSADDESIKTMIDLSIQYSAKFGFSFVTSDAALDAEALLAELGERVRNHRGDELDNAANALGAIIQRKIRESFVDQKSNLEVTVVDISLGAAAQGISASLLDREGRKLAAAVSDECGVLDNWSAPVYLDVGQYHLQIDSNTYFRQGDLATAYPTIIIHFEVTRPKQLQRIQLSISPFGYSTSISQ